MSFRVLHFSVLSILVLLIVAVAACSGNNSVAPTQSNRPTATRRSNATPGAATAAPRATNDGLDDSANPAITDDPNATPDPLDDSSNPNPDAETPQAGPQVQNGNVVLKNTAWLLAGGEQVYQFCENGKWQVVQGDGTVETRGTFQAEGKTLNLKNTVDNQESKYAMTWKAPEKKLELKEGNATLTLEYDGAANCE